ncbi:MAG: hypothetical protein MZV64_73725 [Ignavibacteriales bacterium]|nr:hypothetical protein [Ignavibacteriales bacterium]
MVAACAAISVTGIASDDGGAACGGWEASRRRGLRVRRVSVHGDTPQPQGNQNHARNTSQRHRRPPPHREVSETKNRARLGAISDMVSSPLLSLPPVTR